MSLDTRNPRRLPAHRRRELEISRADLEAALLGARRYCFIQSSLAIPNEAGASVRGDTNTGLQAAATFQSGASAPGTTYADQYWYDTTTNTLKKRNQANSAWFVIGTRDEAFLISRSSNTVLGLSDYGKTFYATGTFTQTLTAAATLGDGWFCWYRNDGTGVITIDPNASETIDGFTTIVLNPGETCRIACNGSLFKTQALAQPRVLLKRKTADQSVTSSTTPTNDNDLTFAIAANEEWIVTFQLDGGAAINTTGFKFTIAAPAGATLTAFFADAGDVSTFIPIKGRITSPGSTWTYSSGATGGDFLVAITARVVNGATPGNVTLQWAQGTSSATAVTLRADSIMQATRVP